MHRFILLNPNTTVATTEMMVRIAREALGDGAAIEGMTAPEGAPVITEPGALAVAAAQVERMAATIGACAGVLVAAFGDPGLAAVRATLAVPVTGLAEASILAASAGRRRFSIVTTTPALDGKLRSLVAASGCGAAFAGVRYTRSGPDGMGDKARLHDELLEACARALADGAEAIVIGGGPLAAAARELRAAVPVPLIEPVPVAARLMRDRADAAIGGRTRYDDDGGDGR